jgi:hypothetical protein
MPQTPNQAKASQAVAAWLAHNEKNPAWLVDQTGADPGTIGDFLNGLRWPKTGTQGKIEKALGWPPGCIRQIGNGSEPDSVGAVIKTPSYVPAPGPVVDGEVTNEQLYRLMLRMRADSDRIEGKVEDLSRRVGRLEQPDT